VVYIDQSDVSYLITNLTNMKATNIHFITLNYNVLSVLLGQPKTNKKKLSLWKGFFSDIRKMS